MIENNFIELGIVYLMAAIMPGPSIGLILRNSAISKNAGFMAALATVIGTSIQVAIILAVIISNKELNVINYDYIKFACSLYLFYIGFMTMTSTDDGSYKNDCYSKRYFLEAFFVEFTNPLAFSFFISIMTSFINIEASFGIIISYWVELTLLASLWFLSASSILSSRIISRYINRYRLIINIITGGLFIVLAVKNIINLIIV
jgi:threonine/homoserine/homoserine lactone efflux protein